MNNKIISIGDAARELRKRQTLAEQKMWWMLRSRALAGYKFCRQFPIGPFVVDFCCRNRKLVIELDGSIHAQTKEYDDARTRYLSQRGYVVVRFTNEESLNNQRAVLTAIQNALSTCPLPASAGSGCPKGG